MGQLLVQNSIQLPGFSQSSGQEGGEGIVEMINSAWSLDYPCACLVCRGLSTKCPLNTSEKKKSSGLERPQEDGPPRRNYNKAAFKQYEG
jgi:hypothetical protein